MNTLDQLRKEAKNKRDTAIAVAEDHYRETLAGINAVARHLKQPIKRKKRPAYFSQHGGDFSKMTAIAAANAVLQELGPMRLTEITVEVMRRGYRKWESPRAVSHTIRSSLSYHREKGRFSRDGEGRWELLHKKNSPRNQGCS